MKVRHTLLWQVQSLQEKTSQSQTEYKDQVISKDDIANAVLISDADAYSAACETAKTRWEEEVAAITGTVMPEQIISVEDDIWIFGLN